MWGVTTQPVFYLKRNDPGVELMSMRCTRQLEHLATMCDDIQAGVVELRSRANSQVAGVAQAFCQDAQAAVGLGLDDFAAHPRCDEQVALLVDRQAVEHAQGRQARWGGDGGYEGGIACQVDGFECCRESLVNVERLAIGTEGHAVAVLRQPDFFYLDGVALLGDAA